MQNIVLQSCFAKFFEDGLNQYIVLILDFPEVILVYLLAISHY